MSFKRVGDDPTALRVQKVCMFFGRGQHLIILKSVLYFFVNCVSDFSFYSLLFSPNRKLFVNKRIRNTIAQKF